VRESGDCDDLLRERGHYFQAFIEGVVIGVQHNRVRLMPAAAEAEQLLVTARRGTNFSTGEASTGEIAIANISLSADAASISSVVLPSSIISSSE
jgi:hypothetical protein